jgi:hypothetical protein
MVIALVRLLAAIVKLKYSWKLVEMYLRLYSDKFGTDSIIEDSCNFKVIST